MHSSALPVSVLLLTLNEAGNLPGCLAALDWCDDIVVLDSFSTDDTVAVAEAGGCRVLRRRFDDFAGQRNFGLAAVDWKHDWVLHLDADEIVTPALAAEMGRALGDPGRDAYRIPSRMMFRGRWLRHAGMYPAYQVRLTRSRGFRFKQVGHGQKEDVDPARVGTLHASYLHYSFSKGIGEWIDKHNRYAAQEAAEGLRIRAGGGIRWRDLVSGDAYRRRQALRRLAVFLPFRPWLRFGYMFFLRRGFLDGMAGFHYCCLLSIYEYFILLHMDSLRRREVERARGPAPGDADRPA